MSFDEKVLLALQNWRRPFLNKVFLILTYSGTGKAWFVFAIIVNGFNFAGIQIMPSQVSFLHAMFCPLLAWVVGSILKKIISRDRPSENINGYQRIIQSPTCGSFPSSHAAAAISFYAALQLASHPLAPAFGCWALLVSFSRLYLGVHYLSDVLGGAFIGVLIAFLPI